MAEGPRLLKQFIGASASQTVVSAFVLSPTQASQLQLALSTDAGMHVRSAAISFVHACSDLNKGWYSWPTVKLYYSVYYSALAILALKGYCVFYNQGKPLSIHANPGESLERAKGPSHKIACDAFASLCSGDRLMSQEIDNTPPLEWLVRRREETNYTGLGFFEPVPPDHFELIASYGLRRLLSAYVEDDSDLYTFDPQHAMLSFPAKILMRAKEELDLAGQYWIDRSARDALLRRCCDVKGPIPALLRLVG